MAGTVGFLSIILSMIIISSTFSLSVPRVINNVMGALWNFRALLTGGNEVPAVSTTATGLADFRVSDNYSNLRYRVNLTGISNVTGAHVHMGKMGQTNGIVADLFQIGYSKHKKTSYGMIVRGNITDSVLKGQLKGKNLKELIKAIDSRLVFININSRIHPDGEIGGQLLPINSTYPNTSSVLNSTR